jgi:enamine deaminase RidA (YjgF/YER057c/UK114 family)
VAENPPSAGQRASSQVTGGHVTGGHATGGESASGPAAFTVAGGSGEGRLLVSSGGPYEESIGYSRAVVAGPFVLVSGCTALLHGTVQHEGDPHGQTLSAFNVVERALAAVGCSLADVVQTRMYLTHISDQEEVGRAHAELFGAIRPASTMVQVAGLVDPRMLVEVEAIAYDGQRR